MKGQNEGKIFLDAITLSTFLLKVRTEKRKSHKLPK